MDPEQLARAEAARGFMPPDEGIALYEAGASVADGAAPMLEIGSYCGKSGIYLGTAARERDTILFALDHHRGSEENQPGWEWHEPDLVDPAVGVIDTLPHFRRTIYEAGLEGTVVALVADSPVAGRHWHIPLSLLFIDGGHGADPAHRDYETWVPWIERGGLLVIHDVFPDPADGGRPPYEIYCRAIESGAFEDVNAQGSLRVLRRTAEGL